MHLHLPEIDEFAQLNSPIHLWDARVKIVSLLGLIISVVLLNKILPAFLGLSFSVILLFISKIPFRFLFAYLKWVLLFALFFAIIMPLTASGDEIAIFYFLSVSKEGALLALLIVLRATSAAMLVFLMIGTAKLSITMKALSELKVPNKLIQIFMFAYRYIFIFIEELAKMFTAAKARAFKEKTDIQTLKTIGNILGMLFVKSYERSRRVYNAMLARGYTGRLKILHEFHIGRWDYIKGFIILGAAILLQFLAYTVSP